jgi:ligand-binding SRPBCC domain-containing protein
MVRGAFRSFTHTHEFRAADGGTLMIDTFRYASPLGPLGRLADFLFLERYMRRLLTERAAFLKRAAEAG